MSCSKSGLLLVAAGYKMAGKEKWNTNPWVQYLLSSLKSIGLLFIFKTNSLNWIFLREHYSGIPIREILHTYEKCFAIDVYFSLADLMLFALLKCL
jgi:hypothetical protein